MPAPPNEIKPQVEGLRTNMGELIAISKGLRADVRSAERVRRLKEALMLVLIGLLLFVAWQNYQNGTASRQTAERIADCTTAGSTCYEQGQARTAGAIRILIRSNTVIVECSRELPGLSGPEFDRKFEACVARRLAMTTQPAK